jgi:hypothetical protein
MQLPTIVGGRYHSSCVKLRLRFNLLPQPGVSIIRAAPQCSRAPLGPLSNRTCGSPASDSRTRAHAYPRHVVPKPAQAYEPEVPVEVREWIGLAPASPGFVLDAQPPAQPHSGVVGFAVHLAPGGLCGAVKRSLSNRSVFKSARIRLRSGRRAACWCNRRQCTPRRARGMRQCDYAARIWALCRAGCQILDHRCDLFSHFLHSRQMLSHRS